MLFVLAVCAVPAAIFALESWLEIWPHPDYATNAFHHWHIRGNYIFMELATATAAFAALYFIRYPILMMPAAVALWLCSLDVSGIIFGTAYASYEQTMGVTLVFGLAVIAISYIVDRRFGEDFALYLYAAGLLSFLGGLTILLRHYDPITMFMFFIICCFGIMFAGVYLRRPIFYAFAIGGTLIYCFVSIFNVPYNMRGSETFLVLFTGAAVLIAAYVFDRRLSFDASGWFYVLGAVFMWGGLIESGHGEDIGKLLFLLFNVFYIIISILLERRVFIILGSLGAFGVIGNFAFIVFQNSIALPFVMTIFGIFIIFLGVRAQQNIEKLGAIAKSVPAGMKALLPSSRKTIWDR